MSSHQRAAGTAKWMAHGSGRGRPRGFPAGWARRCARLRLPPRHPGAMRRGCPAHPRRNWRNRVFHRPSRGRTSRCRRTVGPCGCATGRPARGPAAVSCADFEGGFDFTEWSAQRLGDFPRGRRARRADDGLVDVHLDGGIEVHLVVLSGLVAHCSLRRPRRKNCPANSAGGGGLSIGRWSSSGPRAEEGRGTLHAASHSTAASSSARTACGSAWPPAFFITWPKSQFATLVFPPL